mmetsp:Transcript_44241/g.110020  ORF Transcript_44241/g.110020 Transcript_44241/m.110020 type:complete len:420 (+) Transcript_44241:39-1298(+)
MWTMYRKENKIWGGGGGGGATLHLAIVGLALLATVAAAALGSAAGARGLVATAVLIATPRLERVAVGALRLWVLRDDESVLSPGVRGNKARKFAALPTDAPLASYGGAQSNAAAALAALAAARSLPFTYYLNGAAPRHLREAPLGNYAALLSRGAELVELPRPDGGYAALRAYAEDPASAPRPHFLVAGVRLVPQGGACAWAEAGFAPLGARLDCVARELRAATGARTVALVGAGTGASALFLARHTDVPVVALPCAMGAKALRTELLALSARAPAAGGGGSARLPLVLEEPAGPPVRFGGLEPRALDAWRLSRASGLFVDLLYGAPALAQLLAAGGEAVVRALLLDNGDDAEGPLELVWVHTGGLEGVPSQLGRYARLGLATATELERAHEEAAALAQSDFIPTSSRAEAGESGTRGK